MRRNNKLFALCAAAMMSLTALSGCGESSSSDAETQTSAPASETVTSAPAGDPVPSAEDLARTGEMRDLTAAQLVAEMKTGWNLGNSLDVFDGSGLSTETGWGNPRTSQKLVDGILEKGFDVIRVPVTWGNHVDENSKIDEAWLARVQEVVNYAYDKGAFVIINSHHEESWRKPDNAHLAEVQKKSDEIWRQIAERFRDYGDHLIFEGLNEPRIKGSKEEWTGGTEEGRECVNKLNQSFVETVRATGGNNKDRLLLLTTYASSCTGKAINAAVTPDDKHLGYSIHAYTPYAFTYSPGESWELFTWDGSHESEILGMLYDLKEVFVDKGIPVIITEYGAVNKKRNDAEVAKWADYYVSTARSVGIPCVWWDNGYYVSGNELFGIYDRNNFKWFSEPVADAIIKAASGESKPADAAA